MSDEALEHARAADALRRENEELTFNLLALLSVARYTVATIDGSENLNGSQAAAIAALRHRVEEVVK